MNKKKILFVINNLKIGGIQKALVNLLKEISNDYEVSLIVFANKGELFSEIPSNVKVLKVHRAISILGLSQKEVKEKGFFLWILRSIGAIWSKFFGNALPIKLLIHCCCINNKFDYAISYAQFAERHYFSGGCNEFVLNSISAKEKITFLHCDFQSYGGNCPYTRKNYYKFDKIIACSDGTKKQFLKILPELKNKTFVVHNFYDFNNINKLSKENIERYPNNILNIVTVSRLSKEKALDRVIYAVEKATKNGVKIKCHIIGDGPEKNNLYKLSKHLNLEHQINFYGEQKNPYKYMKNADLLVISSIHEAAPMIINEAASLNVPIFSTETISAKEMIVDKKIGWVCKNSTNEFISSLLNIISNDDLLKLKRSEMKLIKFSNFEAYAEFKKIISK